MDLSQESQRRLRRREPPYRRWRLPPTLVECHVRWLSWDPPLGHSQRSSHRRWFGRSTIGPPAVEPPANPWLLYHHV